MCGVYSALEFGFELQIWGSGFRVSWSCFSFREVGGKVGFNSSGLLATTLPEASRRNSLAVNTKLLIPHLQPEALM